MKTYANIIAASLSIVASSQAATLLLEDVFTSESYGASTFNSTLSADQSGSLATISYTVAGYWQDWQIQHGNANEMIMAGWHAGAGADLYASLNHNFAADANSYDQPLQIEFDISVSGASDPTNWATFAIGSSQNAFVNNAANKFSSLFRHNGGTQQFASGSDVSGVPTVPIAWTVSSSTIALVLSDTAGTGSAFDGNGSVAKMYVDGSLEGTWTLSQLSSSDGFLSFEANGAFAHYDNLSISVIPESSTALLGGLSLLALLRRRR